MNNIRRVHSPIIPKLVGLFRDDVPRARKNTLKYKIALHQHAVNKIAKARFGRKNFVLKNCMLPLTRRLASF